MKTFFRATLVYGKFIMLKFAVLRIEYALNLRFTVEGFKVLELSSAYVRQTHLLKLIKTN